MSARAGINPGDASADAPDDREPSARPRGRGDERTSDDRARAPVDPTTGLCPHCTHVKVVRSEKGSTFWMCMRARDDARFAKYPPQPIVACVGFER